MKKYNLHLIRQTAEQLAKTADNGAAFSHIIRELDAVQTAFAADKSLAANLSDKAVPTERREAALIAALEGSVRDEVLAALVNLLRNDALANTKDLLLQTERVALERGNLTIAELKTAAEIGADQRERITTLLKEKCQKDVVLKASVDQELLGGFTLRVEEQTIDASARGALGRLKRELSDG